MPTPIKTTLRKTGKGSYNVMYGTLALGFVYKVGGSWEGRVFLTAALRSQLGVKNRLVAANLKRYQAVREIELGWDADALIREKEER